MATKCKKIPLGNQELEKATGGAGYNEQQWAEWTKAWKDWWIEHYGDIICPKCHMPMLNAIVTYDKDLAYDCYMKDGAHRHGRRLDRNPRRVPGRFSDQRDVR